MSGEEAVMEPLDVMEEDDGVDTGWSSSLVYALPLGNGLLSVWQLIRAGEGETLLRKKRSSSSPSLLF